MDSFWNFNNGFSNENSQFNDSTWVPVMNSQQQQQHQQQPANWPQMANNNAVPANGFFGFGFDFGHQQGNSVPMPYHQGLGIGNNLGCYPNGSLSDILVSGNAGFIPAMQQNMMRSIAPENPVLDLNFPAVWPEFGSEPIMIPNPGSSLVTGGYSGGMTSQVIDDLNLTPIKETEKPPQTANPVQFTPETPNHQAQLDRDELNAILISLTEEPVDHAKDKGKAVANSSSDELLHNIVDPYLQKEGNAEEALDLNKTPHQKAATPKRKKYTPKVIKEDKPQRGRKSTTTPKAAAGHTSNDAENPLKSAKRNMNTQEQGSSVRGQQSAKRVLNFDLEDAVNESRFLQNQNLNLRHQIPELYSRSRGNPQLHASVSQQSGTANQHTPELGNLRFHNPGAVFQARVMNRNNAVNSQTTVDMANMEATTAGRDDLSSQGWSNLAADDVDLGENDIFRNGFLQAMIGAGCLGQQYNLYEQQRTPSKGETSAVTQLHDMAGVSRANSAVPITPEQMEKLKNQNAAQVNKTNNVQKRGKGRPPKIQPSASNTTESGAIVPFMGGGGAVVPLDKKRKELPKVDLDPETKRVWNVLMGKEASDEHEDETLKKEKYWEAEREVFRGRTEAFIARMHQVQGDRRFSKWKGSVVDSVVGVFLTQNVSDHLSSSVFMNLASEFPARPRDPSRENDKAVIVEFPEDLLNANKRQHRFPIGLNRSSLMLRDCASSQSHSPEQEGISSQGSCVVSDLCHKSEGVNGCSTSKACQISENGSSQVEYVDGSSDSSYPPGFENRHFPVPSISSNHDNSKQNPVERCDDESTSTSPKRPRVSEKTQVPADVKAKGKKPLVEEKIDWDKLRRDVRAEGQTPERSSDAMDTLDYEAIRKSPVEKIAEIIKDRGMNQMLAERIKAFLDRLVEDHGSVDLEWLRDVPPDMAKDYLLSIHGLGLKSVECVRLLTLHHLAFPVDTNVGRIAVRLGWVPLEPLPETLQIHLLQEYPVLESVQKYLWPRLCKLDQPTLYELHYQLITFGKVFCTKTKPNCNACPMRGDCRHFASAFASAKLALPGPAQASSSSVFINSVMPYHMEDKAAAYQPGPGQKTSIQPIIEEPASPEPMLERDIEDWFIEDDDDEIPTINLNIEAFKENIERLLQENNGDLDGSSMSQALVALDPRLSSLPPPQLKSSGRLRTEHNVYELPDDHFLLQGMQRREVDDPSPYLLAIWTPGETKYSIQPPKTKCKPQDAGQMCNHKTCYSCNSIREEQLQIVRGTIFIPCRTATKGSFPLNGTYFQVNEMFADHESSHNPITVPRSSIWNLRRRILYCGKSVTAINRGLTTDQIQHCFWRGFVCVRAFDRLSGAPRPLVNRLHVSASYGKGKGKSKLKYEDEDEDE